MSILIPNIKIPDHCWECPLMSHLLCGYSKEIIPGTKKRDDCPLVEVPNHGRLIDADAVIDLVMQYCPDDDGVCSKAGADLRELLDEIENLPTVIPADPAEGA